LKKDNSLLAFVKEITVQLQCFIKDVPTKTLSKWDKDNGL
jgi:hypothetical protein